VVRPIATRWMDNDVYGHVNTVHSYWYFDTSEYIERLAGLPAIDAHVEEDGRSNPRVRSPPASYQRVQGSILAQAVIAASLAISS
jgi:acyl-CoA thioester hydrolase